MHKIIIFFKRNFIYCWVFFKNQNQTQTHPHRDFDLSMNFNCMIYFSAIVLPVKWYKSIGVGTNPPNEVMFFEIARSKVECSVMCNTIPACQSYLFDIQLSRCTLLTTSDQQGPISDITDILHFKRCAVIRKILKVNNS